MYVTTHWTHSDSQTCYSVTATINHHVLQSFNRALKMNYQNSGERLYTRSTRTDQINYTNTDYLRWLLRRVFQFQCKQCKATFITVYITIAEPAILRGSDHSKMKQNRTEHGSTVAATRQRKLKKVVLCWRKFSIGKKTGAARFSSQQQ